MGLKTHVCVHVSCHVGLKTKIRSELEMAAESSYAWLSVIVKRGPKTLIPRKVIKMEWEKNFGELLTAVDLALANSMI